MKSTDTWLNNKSLQLILFVLTFGAIFIYHTFPLGLSDFWWHLNSGRWIWEHGVMPVDDPFLYSSPSPLDARAYLILRGYPLSQLLMLGIQNVVGMYGLVVLKALLMTLFYGLLWKQLRRNGLHPVLALAVVGALPMLFFRFDELRPQMFSFIGAMLVLQITPYLLEREKQHLPLKTYHLAIPPVLMLLWANLHRGFIIGIGVLLIYLFEEWLARRRGKDGLSDAAFRRFALIALVSCGVAFINPVGVTAMWASFTEVSGPFATVIDEYFTTFKYFQFHGIAHIGYIILALGLLPAIALLFKWRQVKISHALIVLAFLAEGIMTFRFCIMMVAVVLAIFCLYYARELNDWLFRGKGVLAMLLWCVAIGVLANQAWNRTSLGRSATENTIPVKAIDYLAQAGVAGNIYNFFEFGGYLNWRMNDRKFFIDARNLNWDVYEEYSKVWRGEYGEIFNKYQVGAVFYPVFSEAGKPSRLVAKLFRDDAWGVGYYDGRNVIFINHAGNEFLPVLDKQQVVADVIRRLRR